MRSDPPPKPIHSPLDSLVSRLEQSVHLKRQELGSRLGPVEGALAVYRLALEGALAKEVAASHGLQTPGGSFPSTKAAAEALLAAVQGLPELVAPTEPSPGKVKASRQATPTARTALPPQLPPDTAAEPQDSPTADTTFPKILARSQDSRLVIVGALSGRRKTFPEPWNDAIEWIDTASGGTHAVGNLGTRIKQGRVLGLVICDLAVQHKHTEPLVAAARARKVPIAFADKGGAASILRAFETIEGQL
jgi:hypothetical protein